MLVRLNRVRCLENDLGIFADESHQPLNTQITQYLALFDFTCLTSEMWLKHIYRVLQHGPFFFDMEKVWGAAGYQLEPHTVLLKWN